MLFMMWPRQKNLRVLRFCFHGVLDTGITISTWWRRQRGASAQSTTTRSMVWHLTKKIQLCKDGNVWLLNPHFNWYLRPTSAMLPHTSVFVPKYIVLRPTHYIYPVDMVWEAILNKIASRTVFLRESIVNEFDFTNIAICIIVFY